MSPFKRLSHRPAPAGADLPQDGAADEDDAPTGCGWFDSSHALSSGLFVTEHASPDTLAHALPLDGWIALHLASTAARH